MASIHKLLVWYHWITFMVCFVLCASAADNGTIACPTNCTCSNTEHLSCSNIDTIPAVSDRTFIKSLDLTFSVKKTSLTSEDFTNFTSLIQLDITHGAISSVANDSFDSIKDTLEIIHLRHNRITEIPVGLFSNFPNLKQIVLDGNNIETIQNSTFVNLPKLDTLGLGSNGIRSINDDAFKLVPVLENVRLFSNQLQEIPYIALKPVTKLKHLELSFNKIKSFPSIGDEAIFESLEDLDIDSNPLSLQNGYLPRISDSIKNLNLAFVAIETITDITWVNNPGMLTLRLGGNPLTTLTKGMFSNLSTVKKIYLNAMPHLSSIGTDAFNGLASVDVIDLSHNKQLTQIDVTAFVSTNVTTVFLDHNSLETLQEGLLPWRDMKTVLVVPNNFNCDCNMKWVFTAFKPNSTMQELFRGLNCTTPKTLFRRKLDSLHPEEFVCVPFNHRKRIATGVIVAICCVVFMLIGIILFRNRKAISSKCRRYYQYRRYKNDVIFTVDHDTSVAELDDGDLRPLKEIRLETVPL